MWLSIMRRDGLDCVGFDTHPQGDLVFTGTHEDAAAAANGRTMLAVWPPDGGIVHEWIAAKIWDAVVVCGSKMRTKLRDELPGYTLTRLALPGGRKGMSTAYVWEYAQ